MQRMAPDPPEVTLPPPDTVARRITEGVWPRMTVPERAFFMAALRVANPAVAAALLLNGGLDGAVSAGPLLPNTELPPCNADNPVR